MGWLILFLASVAGAVFAGWQMLVRMTEFLAAFPEGLQSEADALAHRKLTHQKSWLAVLILVLALVGIVSLIGVTATYGGIGFLPMAIATAFLNQGGRQIKEKEDVFAMLIKEYKTDDNVKIP